MSDKEHAKYLADIEALRKDKSLSPAERRAVGWAQEYSSRAKGTVDAGGVKALSIKSKASDVISALQDGGYHPDDLSKTGGLFTARRGFFYTMGGSSEKMAAGIQKALPTAKILDMGEIHKPFKGGAPTRKQSHWWVKFTL